MRQIAKRLATRILFAGRSKALYRLCKRYVNACDNDNLHDIICNGEMRLLREVLPRAKTAFDVGANVGLWTRAALQANPQLAVHCFEPSKTTFEALLANRFPAQVVCNQFALGERVGRTALYTAESGSEANSLHCREAVGCRRSRTEDVVVRTLDEYCSERAIDQIDFLKIDVEGNELAVLQGSREMLEGGKISSIQFEYGGTYLDARILLKDVWDYIANVAPGYRFYKLYPNGPKLVPTYRQSLETFQLSNWVIRRAA